MILEPKSKREPRHIAYRCPTCGSAVRGLLGSFAARADLLKLKCPSGDGELSLSLSPDRERIRISVPCLFCGQSHGYTVSRSIVLGNEPFLLNCPYTNMDICFLGSEGEVDAALDRAAGELGGLLAEMGLESMRELQPIDLDPDEVLPDARIYDVVRYVVKELEAEGAIDCPCRGGSYEIAMTDRGILVYCPLCNASYLFETDSVAAAEEFLKLDRLTLTP